MAENLKGRHFLTLLDYTPEEISYLLTLSQDFKRLKRSGLAHDSLRGRNIVLLFEKDSTRTRSAFEVAGADLGMGVSYFGPSGSQMGKKESIADTAAVISRMYDGIQYRGFSQAHIEELAKYSCVPVWNGLTTEYHPTQILADFLTIQEHKGSLQGVKMAFLGDANNNMGNSLMIGAAKMGMDFRAVAPRSLWPDEELVERCQTIAQKTGATLLLTENKEEGCRGVDVVYTDVWVSMGEPQELWQERIRLLSPYQVNQELMNIADKKAIFMHCLPAFHDTATSVGKEINERFELQEMEVSDAVFRSAQSVVFQEAENRLHTIKAVIFATLS